MIPFRISQAIFPFFRKMAEEELKTNIAEVETFHLPSGQEIQQEDILFKERLRWMYMVAIP